MVKWTETAGLIICKINDTITVLSESGSVYRSMFIADEDEFVDVYTKTLGSGKMIDVLEDMDRSKLEDLARAHPALVLNIIGYEVPLGIVEIAVKSNVYFATLDKGHLISEEMAWYILRNNPDDIYGSFKVNEEQKRYLVLNHPVKALKYFKDELTTYQIKRCEAREHYRIDKVNTSLLYIVIVLLWIFMFAAVNVGVAIIFLSLAHTALYVTYNMKHQPYYNGS